MKWDGFTEQATDAYCHLISECLTGLDLKTHRQNYLHNAYHLPPKGRERETVKGEKQVEGF